jgi:hypothetical protein
MSSVIPTKNLEEMSREELIALVNSLVHQQFQLNMLVASLQNGLAEKDKRLEDRESYIKILETQVLEMNELRALVNNLQAENFSLTKLTQELQREVSDLTYQFHLQQAELESIKQPLTARHFADQADKRAISIAFPKASKRPFSIRSFGNLVSFIDDPEKAERNEQCFVGAAKAWAEMREEDRTSIKSRVDQIRTQQEQLKVSIKTIKEQCWQGAHCAMSTAEDIIAYYERKDEEVIADALKVCCDFLNETDPIHAKTSPVTSSELDSSSNIN